jgi:cytochrome c553
MMPTLRSIFLENSEVIAMNLFRLVFALCLLPLGPFAQAADAQAGKAASAPCQGCHGANGISTSPSWPILAGQPAAYLEAQLKAFQSGSRKNASMNPIAEELNPAAISNLAAYFASLPGKAAGGDAKLAETGKAKAAMCMGCHGNQLQGNGHFPKLAGQHAAYLQTQLHAFKKHERNGGPMNAIVQSLSDEDIKAISAFAATQTP